MKKQGVFRTIGFLVAVIIGAAVLLVCCRGEKGGQLALDIDDSLSAQVSDICGGDKHFYLATRNDILKYDEDGKLMDTFHFSERGISNVAYGDTLYALDWLEGTVLELDKKGNVVLEVELGVELDNVYDLSAYEKLLYLNCTVMEGDSLRDITYRIDMGTRTVEEFMETHGCVYAGHSEEQYMLLAGGEAYWGDVDEKGEPYLDRYDVLGTEVRALARDEKWKNMYYVRDNRVYVFDGDNTTLLHSLEITPDKIVVAGNRLLMLDVMSGELVLATTAADEAADIVVLNLYNIDDSYVENQTYINVGSEFESNHNVKLDYHQEGVLSYDKFLTDVMSGSDKYDIYLVSNMMGDSTGYKANHAYCDLSESEILVGAVQGMYDSVSASAWNGEELFGLPLGVDGEVLCYNFAAYPQYGEETYENWETVLNLIESEDKGKMYKLHVGGVLGNLFNQYLAAYGDVETGEYSFDTPEFREVLKLMKRVAKMELPDSVASGGRTYGISLTEDEILGWPQLSEYVMDPNCPIAAPSIAGESGKCPVYQMFAVVNPNSKHKEEAVDYLEYLCQTGRIEGNPLLYADEEHPELVDFMENRMVSSFEWKISDAEIYPILWEFLDGEISEDEVIEKLTQNVRMQLNE